MKINSSLCRVALLFIGGVLPFVQAAEPGHPVKPLLWKIEGNGLEKPSYLFGTVHIAPPEIQKLHPAAEKAFASAEIIYTEIPLDLKSQMAIAPLLMRKDGKTLSNSIGPDRSAKLDAELKEINPALDATPFQPLKTWGVAMTLPVLKSQLQGQSGIDSILWARAEKENKKTAALETAESQFAIFDKLTEDEQVIMLDETIVQMGEDRAAGIDSTKSLLAAYHAGDEAKLQEEVDNSFNRMAEGKNKELGERVMKTLLEDRDVTMAAEIDKQLRVAPTKIHFFTAGAGHFIGRPGIRGNLVEKGYRITRIED